MKVRRGGLAGPDGWVFELTGGAICLDFVNTIDNRPTDHAKDLLRTYSDLAAWSQQAGVLKEEEAGKVLRKARRHPAAARETLDRARALREALFGVFSSAAEGDPAPVDALGIINAELTAAFGRQRIKMTDKGYALTWAAKENALDRMLPPVVRSAVHLLTSPELSRVRVCAAEKCAWLFLDRSRNRTRQWCDMRVCGNRAKARRHYERSKYRSSP